MTNQTATTEVSLGAFHQSLAGKYLSFALSKERYGLEILKVQEIIGVPHITKVPRCPDFVRGVINLRGKIIPVVELRRKFDLESLPFDEKTCIIVVSIQKGENKIAIGVIVDTVLEVMDFSAKDLETAPDYGAQLEASFIMGIGRKENSPLTILIDIEKVLTASDAGKLAELGK